MCAQPKVMAGVFGDQTAEIPKRLTRPAHCSEIEENDWGEVERQWRAWQKKIGFDPDAE